jgi:regulatory protein
LSRESLQRLALRYVERYATSRARLTRYLQRKIGERGWAGEGEPPTDEIVARMAELGYVNDRQFAEMRTASLSRRGYGRIRINAALHAAGIGREDVEAVASDDQDEARATALAFARRKRIGPFAEGQPDQAARRRAFAAMARAGHPLDIIREILTHEEQ